MSVFILYIGVDKKTKKPPTQEFIDEVISRHRTEQDAVVIKNTDETFDGGFAILKEDDNVVNYLRRDKSANENLDYRTARDKVKQAKIIKDGGKYSQDTSVTKGVKPYSG